jgi:hypothetical protein
MSKERDKQIEEVLTDINSERGKLTLTEAKSRLDKIYKEMYLAKLPRKKGCKCEDYYVNVLPDGRRLCVHCSKEKGYEQYNKAVDEIRKLWEME